MMSSTQCIPELTVENFGPIQRANIRLHPLTLFVGPSNTGKSYLSILIYAFHCYFGSFKSRYILKSEREFIHLIRSILPNGTDHLRDSLTSIGKQLRDLERDNPKETVEVIIPEPLAGVLREVFQKASCVGLHEEISRCFGLDIQSLHRHNASYSLNVILRISQAENFSPLEHHFTLDGTKSTSWTHLPEGIPLSLYREHSDVLPSHLSWLYSPRLEFEEFMDYDGVDISIGRIELIQFIAEYLAFGMFGPFARSSHYLPADRTGVMHAHKAVVSTVLKRASMAGASQSQNIHSLSGVLADFLEGLMTSDTMESYISNSRRPSGILNICKNIEEQMLNGSISTDYSDILKYPQFSFQPDGWENSLPLKNASSMVSELAPILLCLRNHVNNGDVLIVEEPESHLHPSMQVQLMRELAAIVNAGVRVIVTTHSEWMLEELANLTRMGALPSNERDTIDGGSSALSPEKVGAWLFQPGEHPNGSTVSQIDLDESGLYPSGFDDVAIALHNNWARISNKLEKSNGSTH